MIPLYCLQDLVPLARCNSLPAASVPVEGHCDREVHSLLDGKGEVHPNYPVPVRPFHLLTAPDLHITPKVRSFIDSAIAEFDV